MSQDNIDNSLLADRGGRNVVNRTLPWVCVLAAVFIGIVAWMTWMAASAAAEARFANQRISDSISSQAQIQTAYEQTLKYYTGEVVKAQTETRMLEYYVNDLTVAAKEAKIVPKDYSFQKYQQQRGK